MDTINQSVPFDPVRFDRWGRFLLAAGFAGGLFLLLLITWYVPVALPFIPFALLGAIGAVYLFQRPQLNLYVVLAGFVVHMNHEKGFQITEVVYGLYYMGYLAFWYGNRLFLDRRKLARTIEDKALLIFLSLVTLIIPISLLYEGDFKSIVSEWTSLIVLAFYFPIKEACAKDKRAIKILLLILAWIGLFVAIRNLLEYSSGVAAAKYVYQVARGRVIANDHVPMVSSLFALVFIVFSEKWKTRLVYLTLFLFFVASLILTLSRSYWVAFAFGALILFMLVGWPQKRRMIILGSLGLVSVLGLGMLFFGNLIHLIFGGLIERLSSLGSATSSDISFLSRFYEAQGAIKRAIENPILGHGLGVSYHFFDIISHQTLTRIFIHNGYVSLWYRFGVWGLILVPVFWFGNTWRGIAVYRVRTADPLIRKIGLACACVLIAFVLSTNTSNPFFLSDFLMVFAYLPGLAAGAYEYVHRNQVIVRPE